jgi:hypothetical protein
LGGGEEDPRAVLVRDHSRAAGVGEYQVVVLRYEAWRLGASAGGRGASGIVEQLDAVLVSEDTQLRL